MTRYRRLDFGTRRGAETMAHDLRFQVIILPNAPWDELLRRFTYIEELGFDLVTTGDHFVDWNNPSIPWLEAWTVLAAVARETTRIRIATYVTQIPLRNPALLARQALSVDHISGGRLEVGLGVGLTIDPAYEMMGIPNWEGKERVARFKEYVEIVDHDAVQRGHDVPGKVLSGQRRPYESAAVAEATATHSDRGHGAGDAETHRAFRRRLEQPQFRRHFRGTAR